MLDASSTIPHFWMVKEGIGNLSSLLFIKYSSANSNPSVLWKPAMMLQQTAYLLETATPLLPTSAFVPVSSLASALHSPAFMFMGAINAKACQTIGPEDLAKTYMKLTIVNSVASSAGIFVGVLINMYCTDYKYVFIPAIATLRVWSFRKMILEIDSK